MATVQGIQSTGTSVSEHVAALQAGLYSPHLALVLVFLPSNSLLHPLAEALTRAFAPVPVVGCSTAGGIGPAGYQQDSVTALAFYSPHIQAEPVLLDGLVRLDVGQVSDLLHRRADAFRRQCPHPHLFALTLYDGLCGREDVLASAVHACLHGWPVCGGSAGDNVRFRESWILHQGQLRQNAGLVLLMGSDVPVRVFKTEHFRPSEHRMVITAADPQQRMVTEIDGEPAATAYARAIGVESGQLGPVHFARHPLMVRINGTNFLRSVQRVNGDGSLSFFCAIDTGLVLRAALPGDMAGNLRDCLDRLGTAQAIIGFDCLFRGLEIHDHPSRSAIESLWASRRLFGFSTYGEQYQGMHINQTLTGLAFGGDSPGEACHVR